MTEAERRLRIHLEDAVRCIEALIGTRAAYSSPTDYQRGQARRLAARLRKEIEPAHQRNPMNSSR